MTHINTKDGLLHSHWYAFTHPFCLVVQPKCSTKLLLKSEMFRDRIHDHEGSCNASDDAFHAYCNDLSSRIPRLLLQIYERGEY